MPDELYGGDGPTVADAPAPDAAKPDEGGEEKEHKTFLLNKEIDPSFKVGEEMVVKVVAVHDKEYEVEYSESPPGEGEGKEGMAPASPEGAESGGGSGGASPSMYG